MGKRLRVGYLAMAVVALAGAIAATPWRAAAYAEPHASVQASAQAGVQQQDSMQQTPQAVSSDQQTPEKQADLYMARKFFKEASEAYQKAIAADPQNATLYNKLGIAYHQLLSYDPAKKAYRKAILLNPRFAPAVNNLAAVEYAQKHYKAAILTYLKALKLTPSDAVIYSNLGTAYFALERYDYAVSAYRYALALDPQVFQHSGRTGNIVHQRDEKNSAAFNFYMAKSYADLKDVENTVLSLRKAWEEGYQDILKGIKDKVFDFLANEPKFIELLTQIQVAEAKKNQPQSGR